MMQSLDEKKRDIFEVVGEKGLFSVEKQSIKLSERDLSDTGQIPVFSSQTSNNGVMGFTNKAADFFIKDTPALIFGDHTKSMNISNHSFCAADNVKVLRPQNIPFDALFYVSCAWKKRIPDMGYARHWRKAKRVGIELPVTDSGKPDYGYMAQYASEMRRGMLMRYKNYVAGQLSQMEYKDIPALDEKEWKAFRIGELFEVSRPKARNKDDYDMGDIPFVASGAINNGVMKCCKTCEGEQLDAGNCITVSPVDGSSFYQPMDFLGRGGAGSSILMLRSDDLNLFRGEFMARMIQQTCSKYNYGHMGNKDSIKRERVLFPVNNSGEPDYAYMEQYAKNMMLRKYKQYLTFISSQDEAQNV